MIYDILIPFVIIGFSILNYFVLKNIWPIILLLIMAAAEINFLIVPVTTIVLISLPEIFICIALNRAAYKQNKISVKYYILFEISIIIIISSIIFFYVLVEVFK